MKLGLITPRYLPETAASAKRAAGLASSLRAAGHRVTVLTRLSANAVPAEGRNVDIEDDGAENATWRFRAPRVARADLFRRLLSESGFAADASRGSTGLVDFDGVIASTPFVFNLVAARSYGVPTWFDLRDLTWEYARDLAGRSSLKRFGASLLGSVARTCLRGASGVSTTTDGQRQYLIDHGVAASRVHVIPNGVPRWVIQTLDDLGKQAPSENAAGLRVVYAGLLGFAQGLDFVARTIEAMHGGRVELSLFGDGVDRAALLERSRRQVPPRLCVEEPVDYAAYLRVIASADVLLASLRPEVKRAIPSKIFEYMAAGKPILFVGSGEGARLVEAVGAGLSVPHGDSRRLSEVLADWRRDPALRRQLGENGRRWVRANRVKEQINRDWVDAIESAFSGPGRHVFDPRRRSSVAARLPSGRAPGDARSVKRVLRLVSRAAESSGVLRVLERGLDRQPDRLRVLVYHRVLPESAFPAPCPGLVSATPEGFSEQMKYVSSCYRVVSIGDVLDAFRNGRRLPPRSVLVTFDDAYRDFSEYAWPVLRRLALPATLFVPTGFPDRPGATFWWDRLYQALSVTALESLETTFGSVSLATPAERLHSFRTLAERLKNLPHHEALDFVERTCEELGDGPGTPEVLGWSALRSLVGEGLTLGAHTRTHPAIDRISPEEVRSEVRGSVEDLEREMGSSLPVFAYPAGRLDDRSVRAVRDSGIELAFTTRGGINDLATADPLRLRRIHVGPATTRSVLRAKLLGIKSPVRSSRP